MDKLVLSYQLQLLGKLDKFLEFLSKDGVSRVDKDQAVAEFNAYLSKLIASLRQKSNALVIRTCKQAAVVSLRADKRLAETAARAGADLEGGDE